MTHGQDPLEPHLVAFEHVIQLVVGSDVTDATEVISVVMPNEASVGQHQWIEFVTSVDEIEKETGYDFLAKVPDGVETVIEARSR